jgi:predicted nuclease of predicted toxin-antitoxin system
MVKFLVDMPLSPEVAEWLASQGHDAVHVASLGMHSAADGEILERAAAEQRVVITADLDYPRLLALTEWERPGLILFRGGDYSEQMAIDRLACVLGIIRPEDMSISIVVVEKGRIRQRRLPL